MAAARRRSLAQNLRDMVLSMVVVVLICLVVVAVAGRAQPTPTTRVDYQPVLIRARAAADFPVLAPVVSPADWTPTSARYEPLPDLPGVPVWQVGWVTAGEQYVGLSQARTTDRRFLAERTRDGRRVGVVTLGSTAWERWENAEAGERSLVCTTDGVTTVVTGTVDWTVLEPFATSLQGG